MNINVATQDKLRHVLIVGESKQNTTRIIQTMLLEDIKNNCGAIYITTSQLAVDNIIKITNNNSSIIQFNVTSPFEINEQIYRIRELNLRALMDNGKIFVLNYNPALITQDQIAELNKLIISTAIQNAFDRRDGKEYDINHELIYKGLVNENSKYRKPFFIYLDDCYQYLNRDLMVALGEIKLVGVGMIFNLISDGNIDNTNRQIESLVANTGSKFLLKTHPKDIETIGIDKDIVNLKRDECLARIMKDGLKLAEAKMTL